MHFKSRRLNFLMKNKMQIFLKIKLSEAVRKQLYMKSMSRQNYEFWSIIKRIK